MDTTRRCILVLVTTAAVMHAAEPNEIPSTVLDDAAVRILVCTPQGPLIVQLNLTSDGFPFRHAFERLIDGRVDLVSTPDAEPPAWNDALDHPQFRLDWGSRIEKAATRELFITEFDADWDGRMQRHELRSAFLPLLGGDAVRLVAARASANGEANQNLLALLDADGDGRFSRTELDRAVERVSKYDYSRDGTVRDSDLGKSSRRDRAQTTSLGTVLGPSQGAQDAVRLLREHYADGEGQIPRNAFQIAPDLFERLDADRDGQLRDAELARIGSLTPQIVLSSNLPETEDSNAILELKGTSPGLVANHTAGPHEAMFHRWQCGASRLDIHTLSGTATGRPTLRVRGLFQAYDRNGNGYLERTEANDSAGSRFRPDQFDGWDADGDGQIFPKELAAAFEREAALTRCWFQIALTRHPPSLWSLVDRNRDGTLSEREMHSIRPTLAEFDADGDGEIAYHELPFHFVMQLARGDRELNETSTVPSPPLASFKPKPGPKWFHKMDANRDGDLSQREFLGTREQFERMDADRDGLIDGKEAEAATP